jgi:hypothetical protein
VEYNAVPSVSQLPGGLASGQSATNDMHGVRVMSRHAIRIATRSRSDRSGSKQGLILVPILTGLLAACASNPAPQDGPQLTANQEWVQAVCYPEDYDATGWPQYRLGDLLIRVPAEYRVSEGQPYQLLFRGPRGSLTLYLHRNARYTFDTINRPRRGQVWCGTRFGGYGAEAIAWNEGFQFGTAIRVEATWGGQDVEKWLYGQVTASRLDDARALRHALRTIIAVQDTVSVPR